MIGLYHREIPNNNTIYKVHLKRTGSTSSQKRMTAYMTQPFLHKVEYIYFVNFQRCFRRSVENFPLIISILILENLYDFVYFRFK